MSYWSSSSSLNPFATMSGEEKTVRATTKRRRAAMEFAGARLNSIPAISRRVTRLSKSLRAANPTHMYTATTGSIWNAGAGISTTGVSYSIGTAITQGDDYFQRFGNHIDMRRLRIMGFFHPGSTASAIAHVRCTIFRAQSAVAFVASLSSSYNPIVGSNQTQLLYDKYYCIPVGTAGNPTAWQPAIMNINLKLKHRQKYTGTGAGAETGESIFVTIQSDIASGTGAPTLAPGFMELYFTP